MTPWYQSEASLREAFAEHGSWEAAGRAHGVAASTIKSWVQKLGLQHLAVPTASTVVVEKDPDPVLVQENRELKSKLAAASAGDLKTERVVRRLEEAIENVRPQYDPKPWRPTPSSQDRTAQEMVLLFSDTHASEVVSLEETRGINQYNWEIMLDRMADIRTAILSHKEHFGFEVSKLHVFFLGDMLSGDIHEELAITNDRPTAEAVVQLARDTVAWLEELAEWFPEIHLAGVPGNHPRASKKPSAKQAHNNADWLYYKLVEAYLQTHSQFTFAFPRGSFNVQVICDRFRALLMHGDGIRSTMPGVPWAGVNRRITTLEQQFVEAREPLDFVMLGHFHTRNVLDGISTQTFMNGSVKGVDEYSLKQFGSGRRAAQTLLTFHPKRGWTGQYSVDLERKLAASEGWG